MRIIFCIFSLILMGNYYCFAQGKLVLYPNTIEFKDDFDRLKNVYFVNEGPDTLSVDSIHYKNYNFYFLRFDKATRFPFKIPPYDTVKMDCILTNYYFIPSTDTLDTMSIYNNGQALIERLNIKIDYFDAEIEHGTINGYVSENGNPISNAVVYFFYQGNYIIKSTTTNLNGFYSAEVRPGTYSIAAEKDSFYITFYDQKFDPVGAKKIKVANDSTKTVDINLARMENTGLSISGKVFDFVSSKSLLKGMIVARRGRHTPSKINSSLTDSIPNESYTAIVNSDGSYTLKNIIDPNYYIVQAFSDYYVPTYYSSGSTAFWQEADSINVNSSLSDINIFLPRDSSIGSGTISGKVIISQDSPNNILIFAKSLTNNFFNYTTTYEDGSFKLTDLPFGSYELVAQKIGFNSSGSSLIQIYPSNENVNNIIISFDPASVKGGAQIPVTIKLFQNYPNPFNPGTVIRWELPARSHIILKVYDVLGREIATLVNEEKPAGQYEVEFKTNNLPSGIYFYSITAGNFHQTRKMVLLR